MQTIPSPLRFKIAVWGMIACLVAGLAVYILMPLFIAQSPSKPDNLCPTDWLEADDMYGGLPHPWTVSDGHASVVASYSGNVSLGALSTYTITIPEGHYGRVLYLAGDPSGPWYTVHTNDLKGPFTLVIDNEKPAEVSDNNQYLEVVEITCN